MIDAPILQGNFKGLQHLGIPSSNLSLSVKFYARHGFKQILSTLHFMLVTLIAN